MVAVYLMDDQVITRTTPSAIMVPVHFILRRAHSFLGVLPLSVFLILHFIVGATAMSGAAVYNEAQAPFGRGWLPALLAVFVIILPLLFHGFYGITVAVRARNNPFGYPFPTNWAYTAQRFSGYFLAIFVMFHIYYVWGSVHFSPKASEVYNASPFNYLAGLFSNSTFMVLYYMGVAAAAFHCANGLRNFLAKMGIAPEGRLPGLMRFIPLALFIILAWMGFAAINALHRAGS